MKIAVPRKVENETGRFFSELLDEISPEDGLYTPCSEKIRRMVYDLKEDMTWGELAREIGVSRNTLKGIRDRQACEVASLANILRYSGKTDKEISEIVETVEAKNYSKEINVP
ncbi:MAG: hypothetical protein ABEJ91_00925, partial [Candidatus Nanohaloarchaea archaeon]